MTHKYKITLSVFALLLISQCSLFTDDEDQSRDVLIAYENRNNNSDSSRYDYDIWVTDFDGAGDRKLLSEIYDERSPRFDPEGSGVYFITNQNYGLRDISFADTAGNIITQLTAGFNVSSYDVGPGGNRLVFADNDSPISNMYLVDSDGDNLNILGPGWDPVFTDNGTAVIFLNSNGSRNIRKITFGDSDTLEITTGAPQSWIHAYSENKERFIVWSRPGASNNYSYYFMDNEGQFLYYLSFSAGTGVNPNLSSDGMQLVYNAYSYATNGNEIYSGNVGIASPRQLTKAGLDAFQPAFFPDDDFVLYLQRNGNEYNLYHVDIKGKAETRVSHNMFSGYDLEYDIHVY